MVRSASRGAAGDRLGRVSGQRSLGRDVNAPVRRTMSGTTRRVALAYGSSTLEIDVPADATVVMPAHRPPVSDELATLRSALERPVAGRPLRELVPPGARVAISICDATRPQPRRPMLEALAQMLDGLARPEDVVVLIATGTHSVSTDAQRREMLGDEILGHWRVEDHNARAPDSLRDLGVIDGVPVFLNREWVDADVRITTGFVEPHFFAGFSGGPKMVAPGLAGLETVLTLHDARRIGDERAVWGICEGNPVHDDIRAIAEATGVDFALDVVLNREQKITAVFAGDLFDEHRAACAAAVRDAMRQVEAPFDVVLTTNSGFPLDQNLYQAVKGLSAA